MYVLDTNVISELRKAKSGKADNNVVDWANTVSATRLFLSVITILELETSLLLVERRDPAQGAILRSWLNALFYRHFRNAFLTSMSLLRNVAPSCTCLIPGRTGMPLLPRQPWFTA